MLFPFDFETFQKFSAVVTLDRPSLFRVGGDDPHGTRFTDVADDSFSLDGVSNPDERDNIIRHRRHPQILLRT